MDPNIRQSIIDRLKQTNNVLVTVSNNPTVDQLSACIGLTLFLNKLGKHATAVFSGAVPPAIEFLKPEETIEKDTNSLRDFIIALDKSKADKLRYKVEDKVVKIFITPYRTSLSQDDLNFSQGDFNVDVVIALGVQKRDELDQAITAHGRILHDATVVSINNGKLADLGALNWNDDKASSLCEMVAELADSLQANTIDSQMATAFLTGVVAQTDRFSNPRTTSRTMSLSAKLMAAGANQQLVATKLAAPTPPPKPVSVKDAKHGESHPDGMLEIEHEEPKKAAPAVELPQPVDSSQEVSNEDSAGEIHIDDDGNLITGLAEDQPEPPLKDVPEEKDDEPSRITLQPPTLGGTLTANAVPNLPEPSVNPLNPAPSTPLLSRDDKPSGGVTKSPSANPNSRMKVVPAPTLSDLEEQVDSPHAKANSAAPSPHVIPQQTSVPPAEPAPEAEASVPVAETMATGIEDARKAVEAAAGQAIDGPLEPVQALNSQPLGGNLHPSPSDQPNTTPTDMIGSPSGYMTTPPSSMNLPSNLVPPDTGLPAEETGLNGQSPTAPPPVPPPMMPPSFAQPSQDSSANGSNLNAPL